MVHQVALLPAGCQPWNRDVVCASGSRFAYSASLAIYIYGKVNNSKEFRLLSIMSEHKCMITSICWSSRQQDYLASSSEDGSLIVWDVSKQQVVVRHTSKEPVYSLGWVTNGALCLSFMGTSGPLWLWHLDESKNLSLVKDSQSFLSSVTMFRWHHERVSFVVFGHLNGSVSMLQIGGKTHKHIFKPESTVEDDQDLDPVIALEWDPLSQDYLLICNQQSGVRLVDLPSQRPVMVFQLPSLAAQIQTVSWVESAPGMFVSGDCKSGTLRIWSVSNPLPLENIKVKGTGFHRLQALPSEDGEADVLKMTPTRSEASASKRGNTLQTPRVQVVCTFKDGGVGLYHIGRKKWSFLREQGHTETIFDCKFSPDNPDHLATASFDGTIKIWDVTSMTFLKSSPGNEGVIYHISWAPADLNCIAACTSKHGAFVWDVGKGTVVKRFTHHVPGCKVYCVAWNQVDPTRLMTCGQDGYCVIQQVDGQIVKKYKHPGSVFGCDWSQFNKDFLATGCEDKLVRLFYLVSDSDQPIRSFAGHESKVFHVRWSPLKNGVLCSGSDDGHIRVWDNTRDQCMCVMSGHTACVRGLTWNSEVSNLLVSGSWDFTIRIWDTQDGACLFCILDHGADVYGLSSHPSRPFLLASSSRDSTVRLWLMTSLVQSVELNILARKSLPDGGLGDPMASGLTCQDLCGQVSKTLMRNFPDDSSVTVWSGISKFFSHPCGTTNLWDLVAVVKGQETLLSSSYSQGIVHRKHLTVFKSSEAQRLEMIKMSKFGAGIGAPSREERLQQAADIYMKLGNVQRYCELLVELGRWERALAVAPSVSLSYWNELNQRYCSVLAADGREDVVPFSIAGGNVEQVISFFSSRGQLTEAAVVAQSACEGSMPHLCDGGLQKDSNKVSDGRAFLPDSLTVQVLDEWADFHFKNGSPTLAACCHLAADEQKKALCKLIRGHELELALCVGHVLGGAPQETDLVLELLSRRCEALGKW